MFGLLGLRGSNFYSLLCLFCWSKEREEEEEEARKGNGVCYLSDLEKESYEHQAVALQFANGSGFSSVTHDLPREKG